jgi:hypothetical protein
VIREFATTQRRSGGRLVRGLLVLLATIGVALAVAVLPATALAASQPSIEWTSAWNLTPTDATVGAGINPQGLSGFGAYYEFQVVADTSEYLSEIACPPRAKLRGTDGCGPGPEVEDALPIGQVPDATKGETVTLDLAGTGITLKPGTTYHYRVLAAKARETEDTLQWEPPAVVGPDQTFTTPLASAPSIESESAPTVTPTGATLEATINSEDLEKGAYYQFQVVKNTSEYLPQLACPEPTVQLHGDDGCESPDSQAPTLGALPVGFIAKGAEGQSVSQSLAAAGVTLAPGTTYHYRVLATKRVQSEDGVDWQGPPVTGPDHTFTTPIAPVIDSVSLSHLTPTDATLEAMIDTEGLPTTYEFQMWSSPCSKHGSGCEILIAVPLPAGSLLGSFVPQSVSLDLNSAGVTLGEGEYGFSVIATSEAGTTSAGGGVFEAPPPTVIGPLSTIPPLYGASPPAGSNGGDQPAGSGSSSSALGVHAPGLQVPNTATKPQSLTNAQKLAKALKLCEKKPKKQRPSCRRQAEKKYPATNKYRVR